MQRRDSHWIDENIEDFTSLKIQTTDERNLSSFEKCPRDIVRCIGDLLLGEKEKDDYYDRCQDIQCLVSQKPSLRFCEMKNNMKMKRIFEKIHSSKFDIFGS